MCYANVLCPLCSHSTFENIDYLRISLINVANGPIPCPQCNDILLGLDKLTIHLFSHSNAIPDNQKDQENLYTVCVAKCTNTLTSNFTNPEIGILIKCDMCEFSFPSKELLEMHKLKHQSGCSDPNEKFKKCEAASEESRLHCMTNAYYPESKNEEKIAEICCTNGDSTNSAVLHYSQGQQSSTLVNQKESLLQLIASTKDIRLNESAKMWECDICEKAFTTKYFLKKHKRLHTGEMPYSCKICDRTFTFQQSYHKHILYHNDEKPHVCQTCNRAFKELSTLRNHERIHSGEKPFKCENCGKCFRQRVSFLVHTRIHTGVMPYKCSNCQKSFRYKLSLRTHKCWPAESEKFDLNSAGLVSTSREVNSASLSNFTITDGEKKTYNTSDNFVSISKGNHFMESNNNLLTSKENADSISKCSPCIPANFENTHLNAPTIVENEISLSGVINSTPFSQFLNGIESGYW